MVVKILSDYPKARDCDKILVKRLFETFCYDKIHNGQIDLDQLLYEMPSQYNIVRERGRIQNTLGLFQASPEIKQRRNARADDKRVEFGRKSPKGKTLLIYCDESGKKSRFATVSSFCRVQLDGAPERMDLKALKIHQGWDTEFKFNKVSAKNIEQYKDFFALALAMTPTWFSRTLWLENAKATSHKQEETIWEMLRFMVQDIIMTEIELDRVRPPFSVRFVKDEDGDSDLIFIKKFRTDLERMLSRSQKAKDVVLEDVSAEDSQDQVDIQIADLIAGSFGRLKNTPENKKHPKNEFAEFVQNNLGFLPDAKGSDRVSFRDFAEAKTID